MGMRKTASSTKYEETRIEPMNANQQYTEPVRVEPDADRAVIRRELPRRSPMGSVNRGRSFVDFKMDMAVRKSNKVGPVVANARRTPAMTPARAPRSQSHAHAARTLPPGECARPRDTVGRTTHMSTVGAAYYTKFRRV